MGESFIIQTGPETRKLIENSRFIEHCNLKFCGKMTKIEILMILMIGIKTVTSQFTFLLHGAIKLASLQSHINNKCDKLERNHGTEP